MKQACAVDVARADADMELGAVAVAAKHEHPFRVPAVLFGLAPAVLAGRQLTGHLPVALIHLAAVV